MGASLDILAMVETTLSRNGANAAIWVDCVALGTHMAVAVSIKLLALPDVEVDWEGPSNHEEGKWHNHGNASASDISNVAEDGWDDRATADGCDEEGSATLGMATETAKRECKDGWEDARLEEEHNHEESNAAPVSASAATSVRANAGGEEDHDERLVGKQDVTWLGDVHETSCSETASGKEALGNGVVVCALAMGFVDGHFWVGLLEEIDEVGGNCDLSTDVAELSWKKISVSFSIALQAREKLTCNTEEESVLLAHWLVLVAGCASDHLSLISHIGIGDLRKRSEVEDNGEESDEACDAEVDILDSGEVLAISANILEDHVGSKDWSNNGTDSLEGLRELETELRPLWWTADGDVRVGSSLEGGQTRANDEHGAAEATEAALDSRGPEHQSADAVDQKTEDEGVAVSKLAHEPTRVCERTDEVGPEVSSLQTGGLALADVKSDLEAGVQDVEKTICKTPEEEEHGDQCDWNDRLASGDLRGTCDSLVCDRLAAAALRDGFDRGWSSLLLVVNIVE